MPCASAARACRLVVSTGSPRMLATDAASADPPGGVRRRTVRASFRSPAVGLPLATGGRLGLGRGRRERRRNVDPVVPAAAAAPGEREHLIAAGAAGRRVVRPAVVAVRRDGHLV